MREREGEAGLLLHRPTRDESGETSTPIGTAQRAPAPPAGKQSLSNTCGESCRCAPQPPSSRLSLAMVGHRPRLTVEGSHRPPAASRQPPKKRLVPVPSSAALWERGPSLAQHVWCQPSRFRIITLPRLLLFCQSTRHIHYIRRQNPREATPGIQRVKRKKKEGDNSRTGKSTSTNMQPSPPLVALVTSQASLIPSSPHVSYPTRLQLSTAVPVVSSKHDHRPPPSSSVLLSQERCMTRHQGTGRAGGQPRRCRRCPCPVPRWPPPLQNSVNKFPYLHPTR